MDDAPGLVFGVVLLDGSIHRWIGLGAVHEIVLSVSLGTGLGVSLVFVMAIHVVVLSVSLGMGLGVFLMAMHVMVLSVRLGMVSLAVMSIGCYHH